MTEQTYRDRTEWGPGEWDTEPDRVSWVDEDTGLPCLAKRGGSGAWCGYVGVPLGHPMHGVPLGADDDPGLSVHGGVTYTRGCDGDVERGVCHAAEPGEGDDAWWLGFDCAHAGDMLPCMASLTRGRLAGLGNVYRPLPWVRAEVADLAGQLAAMGAPVWWWLSFARTAEACLGVAVVEGTDIAGACARARALGIHPGGEVMAIPVPAEILEEERARWGFERLIPVEELQAGGLRGLGDLSPEESGALERALEAGFVQRVDEEPEGTP